MNTLQILRPNVVCTRISCEKCTIQFPKGGVLKLLLLFNQQSKSQSLFMYTHQILKLKNLEQAIPAIKMTIITIF